MPDYKLNKTRTLPTDTNLAPKVNTPLGTLHKMTPQMRADLDYSNALKELDKQKGYVKNKARLEAGLSGLSLLKFVPHPLTRGIGIAASLASAAIDGNDSYKAFKKGDTKEGIGEGISAGLNLVGVKNPAAAPINLGKSATSVALDASLRAKNSLQKLVGGAIVGKSVSNDVEDVADGVKTFKDGIQSVNTTKPKPKYGGLWDTNKTAFVDSVNTANSGLNMIKRLYGTSNPKPIQIKGEHGTSTHRMSNDKNDAYSTVVQKPGSKVLTDLGNTDKAWDYAHDNKEFIRFKHPEQAAWYAGNPNGGDSYGGYKQGTGVLPGFKNGVKNMKTYKSKYKKATKGLQDVAVPEQGSLSNVASSSASMAAAGTAILPGWGTAIGAVVGAGMGFLNKAEQDEANATAIKKNEVAKMNRAVDGVDDSLAQKEQRFSKGGKVKTKMIEIEGKGTPEIHTDKNFNVKNLGTTPHSKGGNKVEASEGDIVFNTQNSLAKYNKIAAAIQSGDKQTLTKEKNRLPADSGTKNSGGNGGVKPVMFRGKPLPFDDRNRNGQYNEYQDAITGLSNGSSKLVGANQKGSRGLTYPYATLENSKGTQYRHDDVPQLTPNKAALNVGTSLPTKVSPYVAPAVSAAKPPVVAPGAGNLDKSGNTASNIMQYAGVANNLIQGLKPMNPIHESYFDPQLNKYEDRSQSLRNQSTSAAAIQGSNARNVSGGSAGNMRANQNVAAMSNLDRQNSIDENEMSRYDSIQAQNVGIKNSAGQYNLQRKDMYQGQMADQRATKQQYMDQAASEIGQIGMVNREEKYMRDKDDKQNAVQLAGLTAAGTRDFNRNVDGTQKTDLTSAPATPAATPTSALPTSATTPFNRSTIYTGKPVKTKAAVTTTTTKRRR